MAQNQYIKPQAVPRPTGGVRQDADAMYKWLYNAMAELSFRLEDIEKRLRKLEKNAGGQ